MWDLLNQLYKRFGLWALLGVALVCAAIWVGVHIGAQPCEKVSIFFGLIEYKKAGCLEPRPPRTDCKEWRHLLDVKEEQLDMARQDLAHIQRAASAGDRDAQRALPQRRQFVQSLESEIGELREKIFRNCDGR